MKKVHLQKIVSGIAIVCVCFAVMGIFNIAQAQQSSFYLAYDSEEVINSIAQDCEYYGTTGQLDWCINQGTLTISGNGEMPYYSLNETPWYPYLSSFTKVVIEDGIINVGMGAFYGCSNLISVEMPSVESIEHFAFTNCSDLSSINLYNITNIGDYAFRGCSSLNFIDLSNTIALGWEAFSGCNKIASVDMPNVVTIGDHAFSGCTNLTSVDMPSVTIIEGYAFSDCPGLTTVTIPPGVTYLGMYAFRNCTSLKTVNFNAINCEFTGGRFWPAFSGCTAFTTLNIGPEVLGLPAFAFYFCSYITSLYMPNVQGMGDQAFENCISLVSVSMPNTTYIGSSVFRDCRALESVDMPSVTTIGGYAFSGCSSLLSVEMPSVTTIAYYAFSSCNALTSVDFPKSLLKIGSNAFKDCTTLQTLYSRSLVPPVVELDAFYSVPKTTSVVHVPSCSIEAYLAAAGWNEFENILGDINCNSITISGQVTCAGEPLSGVEIEYRDAINQIFTVTTNETGDYEIMVETGSTVTITPSLYGYTFVPESITLENISGDVSGQDFTASTVGIFNIVRENVSIVVYPNPAKDILHVKFSAQGATEYTILNVTGHPVMQGNLREGIAINIENLPSGVYWLRTEKGSVKFVKQ